jgi:ubiquinone/menaquinone biosynthesis C-methylase UbiE
MIIDTNSEAIEARNTILFDKFARFRHVVTTGLGVHGEAVLARHPPREAVDAAPRFIETATREAKEAELPNARFIVADVQADPLGGPYDQAFSRFGTMFFASPVAAFRNVRRSLARGAKLTMVVSRKKEENPFF